MHFFLRIAKIGSVWYIFHAQYKSALAHWFFLLNCSPCDFRDVVYFLPICLQLWRIGAMETTKKRLVSGLFIVGKWQKEVQTHEHMKFEIDEPFLPPLIYIFLFTCLISMWDPQVIVIKILKKKALWNCNILWPKISFKSIVLNNKVSSYEIRTKNVFEFGLKWQTSSLFSGRRFCMGPVYWAILPACLSFPSAFLSLVTTNKRCSLGSKLLSSKSRRAFHLHPYICYAPRIPLLREHFSPHLQNTTSIICPYRGF